MNTERIGLELDVRSQVTAIRPAVLERAKMMLTALLERARRTGLWRYDATGECSTLPNPSRYSLTFEAGSQIIPTLVYVALRSSLTRGGAIVGMLRLSPDINRASFLSDVAPLIAAFNQSNWQEAIPLEARQETVVTRPLPAPRRSAAFSNDEADESRERSVRPSLVDGRAMLLRERVKWEALDRDPKKKPSVRQDMRRPDLTPAVPASVPAFPLFIPKIEVAPHPDLIRVSAVPIPSPSSNVERAVNGWKVRTKFGSPPAKRIDRSLQQLSRSQTMSSVLDSASTTHAGLSNGQATQPPGPHREKLANLLKQLLRDRPDGIFPGKAVVPLARETFLGQTRGWYSTGCTMELIGLRWVRRIGPGQCQVEQSFLDEYLPSWTGLQMQPKIERSRKGAKLQKQRASGRDVPATEPPETIDTLVARRADLEASVTMAQEALRVFDDRLRSVLGPLAEKLYPSLKSE